LSDRNPIAERRQAAFRAIAGQSGGAKGKLLSPEVLERAQAALETMAPAVMIEVETSARAMADLAAARSRPDSIFDRAHEIRGLAELCGRPAAGTIAGAIRAYRFSATDAVDPDWNLLTQLTNLLVLTVTRPDQNPPGSVERMCREAVVKTMTLEGRKVPEQPW
jgi:hypothetical protein